MASTDRAPRQKKMILTLTLVCAIAGYFAIGGGIYYWKEHVHHYEAGAVSALFALHAMQENYRNEHGSYAESFVELGVPLGARLSGDTLTWYGPYRYRIVRTMRNQGDAVQEYWIETHPSTRSIGVKRSYLMDRNGAIHFTSDTREATSGDRAISPE
jgi:hypothetical protein